MTATVYLPTLVGIGEVSSSVLGARNKGFYEEVTRSIEGTYFSTLAPAAGRQAKIETWLPIFLS